MINSVNPIRTISLFSGGGGLDIGFHRAGFHILACVEIDNLACKTLEKNIGQYFERDCKIINQDITKINPLDITREPVDFIIGGPPCQSFSAIGRRAGGAAGTYDERGELFEHYCRLVSYFKPHGFLFENVRGILSSHKGEDWRRITSAFRDIGYNISYRVLDTADYGVPQHRERLIMVGTREGNNGIKFPRPTHGPDAAVGAPHVTALEAILDLQAIQQPELKFEGKYSNLLKEVPPGSNYLHFTKEMGHPTPSFAWRSRFSDFLYKADPSKPVRTIVAKLGAYSGPFHWENRKFTVDEFKRLQSFPDDYEFVGGTGSILKQIGNSVPPIFAERLAEAVKQQIFGFNLGIDLIDEQEELSFDSRKSRKARATRSKRLISAPVGQSSLFSFDDVYPSINISNTHYFHYLSNKQRFKYDYQVNIDKGCLYRISEDRKDNTYNINIFEIKNGVVSVNHQVQYILSFYEHIGNGINKIECNLYCDSDQGIPVMWDSIEDVINLCSSYQTMMDVYGHFTEPYPSFSLEMNITTTKPSFFINFAKKFSVFDSCSKLLPISALSDIPGFYELNISNPIDVIQELRLLRFDVRVNQTNINIPKGYFRCCYPFTININKQVSVSWKESI
ncbi:DNA cytosine methyltransferase [Herpetosiphon gulosus]|uniref:Cytosine-specific methyltransferase n=1 Tax=Herpetosiphon gulosus TaxID=1973496 RepID=A0ABP9X7Q7_9CHLR